MSFSGGPAGRNLLFLFGHEMEEIIMKKTIVSALTTALVVGAASTTFAATNPFSDVPADHWAYDAVSQLAADGVIEGYGDDTFKGDKNITRYEMAQMVAKAMAKNPSGADKALVDKLAAEFADELNQLGVRVSNLERNADKVKWNGEARYTYTNTKVDDDSDAKNELLFRLEPTAEVNSNWHVKARLDAKLNASEDGENDISLKRAWAQGDYDNFSIKAGKLPMQVDGDSIFDSQMTGAALTAGKDLKFTVQGGRWDLSDNNGVNSSIVAGAAAAGEQKASVGSVGLQYDKGNLSAGAAYHRIGSDALRAAGGYGDHDTANIWSVNGKYRFNDNVALGGMYAQNTQADNYKKAGSVELDYKGAKAENPGSWGAYVAYRHLGQNVALAPTYDGAWAGTKGWEIGTNYAVAKNTVASLKYFNGKTIAGDNDASKVFGRVQFLF